MPQKFYAFGAHVIINILDILQQKLTLRKMLFIILIGDHDEYDYKYNFKRENKNWIHTFQNIVI